MSGGGYNRRSRNTKNYEQNFGQNRERERERERERVKHALQIFVYLTFSLKL